MSIFCIVRKNSPYPPTASGSYGRLADETWVGFKIFKILYKLNYLGFLFVYYHCNVTTVIELHFRWLFSSKAYFKVCFEAGKIYWPFFSYQSLLLGTSVPNDKYRLFKHVMIVYLHHIVHQHLHSAYNCKVFPIHCVNSF